MRLPQDRCAGVPNYGVSPDGSIQNDPLQDCRPFVGGSPLDGSPRELYQHISAGKQEALLVELRYLADAKEQVDKAIAAYEANVRPEAEIDKLLFDASGTACEALRQFHTEEDIWRRMRQRDKKSVLAALTEIIKKYEGGHPHFDARCLPLTAHSLRILGFKPPEEAERLVSMARDACDSLNSNALDLDALVTSARFNIEKLADATCGLARRLGKKMGSLESRKKWRNRAGRLLMWVSVTLGAAMISHAVTPDLEKHLSEAGRNAIHLTAMRGIEYFAGKGVEQAQMDAVDDQQDTDQDEPK
jgi:hypothetical protein